METTSGFVGSPLGAPAPTEVGMLQPEAVQEVLARLARGEGVKRIARALGVDRKTVRAWRRPEVFTRMADALIRTRHRKLGSSAAC